MWSQVGFRKHHCEQSQWRGWNSSWAILNPKRWCCESGAFNMPANLENLAVAAGLEKISLNENPKERQCQKFSNYCKITLISYVSKVMLKNFQARLQQCMNCELPDVYAGFRKKSEAPEIKLPTSVGSSKKQESSRKASTSDLLIMPKPLTIWITTNCGKFFKRWEYQTTWPPSWEISMQVKKQQLELDMEKWTGSK